MLKIIHLVSVTGIWTRDLLNWSLLQWPLDQGTHFFHFRSDSDVIAKLKGTFQERPKRLGGGPGDAKKKKKKGVVEGSVPAIAPPSRPITMPAAGPIGGPVIEAPPNQILFLTNLPEETNEMMLQMLFNQVRPRFLSVWGNYYKTLQITEKE